MAMPRLIQVFLVMLLAMGPIGCTQPLNDRPTLGGQAISSAVMVPDPISVRPRAQLFAGQDPCDRTRWQPTQFVAEYDGVVHGSILRIAPPLRSSSEPREYGRYPSRWDVLDAQANSWFEDLMLTGTEIGRSVIGTPFAIGYLAWRGKLDTPTLSPTPYKRTQQNDWSTGAPAPTTSETEDTHD
jgi:hypothetical protein